MLPLGKRSVLQGGRGLAVKPTGASDLYEISVDAVSGEFKMGKVGEMYPVATREPMHSMMEGGIAVWDSTKKRFVTGRGPTVTPSGEILINGQPLAATGGVWDEGSNNSISYTSGNVGIGTTSTSGHRLNVGGSIAATGNIESNAEVKAFSVTTVSDLRTKTRVRPLCRSMEPLEVVKAMEGVSFVDSRKQERVGFIAQSMKRVLPQVVNESKSTGYLSISYGEITAVLVEAVKTLSNRVEALERALKNAKGASKIR